MSARGGSGSITPEQEQRVLELYADPTVRVNDIADDVGLGRSTIYWILEKNGMRPDRTRRGGETAVDPGLRELGRALSTAMTSEEADALRGAVFAQHERELGMLRARLQIVAGLVAANQSGSMDAEAALSAAAIVLEGFDPE